MEENVVGSLMVNPDRLIPNPLWPGNMVYQCPKCKRVFAFLDEGEAHERDCHVGETEATHNDDN